MKKAVKERGRFGKMVILVTFIVITSLTLVSFSFKFFTLDKATQRLSEIESALIELKAALNVDSVRQYYIQKVIALIDRYNKSMPAEMKYNIANEIYEMSVKYSNLDVDLICATITHESAFTWNPKIVSRAGAMGLMQIMPATGMFLAESEGIPWTSAEDVLFDPVYNIRLGCRYLSTLISMYNIEGGLAAYNGGERRAALWLQKGKDDRVLWEETRGYVPAILKLYQEYTN
ncbi:MAG: lytic transglycosylase domain-containing protein [candidate division KSB1 bacterium]|nr:lytic transglycosylase domain-containing protein [candidate division KSB1 bacterium]MDQ7064867.1 lytic transglycosylase domain-containing protein [candidate division KSB1 bacterium]